MTFKAILTFSLILGFLHSGLTASSKGVPGFIIAPAKVSQNSLLKETTNTAVYNDQDVKALVLHNLGLLNYNTELLDSTKHLVSQFGTRNLLKTEKLNYVFLLDGVSSHNSFALDTKSLKSSGLEHQSALFEVCRGGESRQCVLNDLFGRDDDTSVVNTLTTSLGQTAPEAYLYSSEPTTDSSLATVTDNQGIIYLMDLKSESKFRIASNLQACVDKALKGKYTVDLQKGTITSKASPSESITVAEDSLEDLQAFMGDICSIVGTSTLIQKDTNPSLFTFHITSLAHLEKSLPESQRPELSKVFNAAYDQFMKNLLARYGKDEISGQVLFLNSESKHQRLLTGKRQPWARLLQEESSTGAQQTPSSSTTSLIFVSVLIVFALITAWVCIEMFSIDIQKDSVVYAKFLAGDYFRR